MLCEERIKIHAICMSFTTDKLLLSQIEIHIDFFLTFFHLPSNAIHRLIEHFEDVQSSIDVHNLTSHCDHHRS
jgi:hypothetical protein